MEPTLILALPLDCCWCDLQSSFCSNQFKWTFLLLYSETQLTDTTESQKPKLRTQQEVIRSVEVVPSSQAMKGLKCIQTTWHQRPWRGQAQWRGAGQPSPQWWRTAWALSTTESKQRFLSNVGPQWKARTTEACSVEDGFCLFIWKMRLISGWVNRWTPSFLPLSFSPFSPSS